MDINQYLSMFIDESKEHLQSLNDHLLLLEQSHESVGTIQVIFRSAHTLKGMAATMGFENMTHLTHEMENALDLMRNNKLDVTSDVMDVLFHCIDILELQLSQIIEQGTDSGIEIGEQVDILKTLVSGKPIGASIALMQTASAAVLEAPVASDQTDALAEGFDLNPYEQTVIQQSMEKGFHPYAVMIVLSPQCMLRAARAYMVVDAYEQIGELIRVEPSVEDLEQENFEYEFRFLLLTSEDQQTVQATGLRVSEVNSVRVVPITIGEVERTSRNAFTLVEQTKKPNATEATEASNWSSEKAVEAAQPSKESEQSQVKGKIQQSEKKKPTTGKSVRVDTERLDTLLNLFSELVIDRTRLEKISRDINQPELIETIENMTRISSDLQNIVMTIRMVPVETVFNRFPRMVRDLAKELNKKVDFVITGAETELDRTVVDEIGDPLVHLLRNALDHGLESPEVRLQKGKSEIGTIELKAYQSGNQVFIEVSEDGNGIDRNAVIHKAVDRGLVTQARAESMSDEEVFHFIFQSGFSTAKQISDISGRGVGLDVVKSKIESLGGRITIKSQYGKGTSFIVQLPLTLSIIQAMLVKVFDETYAIPLSSIIETAMIQTKDIKSVHRQSVIDFRGHVVPLLSLSHVFDIPNTGEQTNLQENMVIVRKGDQMVALQVHEFIGQQEIVLKSLGKYLSRVFAISGATILGEGQVALIIDCNALIQ